VIDEARAMVSTVELAEQLCAEQGNLLRRAGREWLTNCLLPDHEDRTPSFYVDPEKDLWFCHGCVRGGDVLELTLYAWGYEKHEVAMAAADLLREFGHDVPERPATWHRKQERQRAVRCAIEETKKNIVRRRLFRHLILPLIDAIEDEAEHARELDRAWNDFRRLTLSGARASLLPLQARRD